MRKRSEDIVDVGPLERNVSDMDWLRAARLKRRAEAGDEKAAAEFQAMEDEKLVELSE